MAVGCLQPQPPATFGATALLNYLHLKKVIRFTSMATFTSGGKSIRIDHYPPNQAGNSPAVILIHGSGGPVHGLDPFASQAAQFGVHVFVLHYFERTGH
ncbi:MAG: hypothetical protein WA672_15845, partial [Candidatus Angelobacter sp.]